MQQSGYYLPWAKPLRNGGAERDRTVDLHNAIVALFQLSYGPIPKEGKELLNTLPSVNLLLGRERIDKQRIQRLFIQV